MPMNAPYRNAFGRLASASPSSAIHAALLATLGAGLAVVASDTAGQREVLTRGPDAGLVLPLHETTALGRALDRLLADPAALRARQVAARRLAESHYSWEREGPRLVALVEAALGRISPP